jgi:hypothetical protein
VPRIDIHSSITRLDELRGFETARVDWSRVEVRLIVADYFTMLEQELLGNGNRVAELHALALNRPAYYHRKVSARSLRG